MGVVPLERPILQMGVIIARGDYECHSSQKILGGIDAANVEDQFCQAIVADPPIRCAILVIRTKFQGLRKIFLVNAAGIDSVKPLNSKDLFRFAEKLSVDPFQFISRQDADGRGLETAQACPSHCGRFNIRQIGEILTGDLHNPASALVSCRKDKSVSAHEHR